MSQFFKAVQALLGDRQELDLKVKKIKDDLVLTVNCDVKGKGKLIHMTIPADDINEEIDSKFFAAINGPVVSDKATFQVNETDVPEKDDDDDDDDDSGKKDQKASGKKTGSKKSKAAPAKKEPVKGKKDQKKSSNTPAVDAVIDKAAKAEEDIVQKTVAAASKVDLPESVAGVQKSDETVTNNTDSVTDFHENVTETNSNTATVKEETKVDEPVTSTATKASDLNPKQILEQLMEKGKAAFDDRKYKDAETIYKEAVDLFPDNDKAQKALENATKWVKAVARLNEK